MKVINDQNVKHLLVLQLRDIETEQKNMVGFCFKKPLVP